MFYTLLRPSHKSKVLTNSVDATHVLFIYDVKCGQNLKLWHPVMLAYDIMNLVGYSPTTMWF